ncbi:hypothetical protein [Halarsenatibacter silvermanii]|uniref:RNase H-fold protein, predicted Holliday junction resolvase n=1 Tax=Halarsenatibacter silvermanii TaxID=321763 RepID=A0A1G9HS26_9FIRM|nr:hypothetical protein [Halarsenatibacter silvermanii]SDL15662.1 RNase H-fold protein, predicted Holliday junction resolvase [Halarsenatibacter silvermanii]
MSDIIALDPGREKVGAAVLTGKGEVCEMTIISRDEAAAGTGKLVEEYHPRHLVIGSGTGSRRLAEELLPGLSEDIELHFVEEKNSTREAQKLYFKEEGGFFLQFISRFIGWRTSRPLDDYAAVILGRRFLENE